MPTTGLPKAKGLDGCSGGSADKRFFAACGGVGPRQAPNTVPTGKADPRLINKVINSITPIQNRDQADALLAKCLASESPQIISFLNAHGLNVCYRNDEFADAVLRSDVVFRDGIGMQLLVKALKGDPGLNMNGTDLIPEFLDKARGETVGILGTREPYLSKAAEALKQAGHNIVFCTDGFKDAASYLSVVEKYRPRIVVLAMGMPKQELVSLYLKENASYNPILINGGAIVDFIAGKVKRAPQWMRQLHLEWVFRLVNEPKRLAKRYVIGNLLFLMRIQDIRKTYIPALDGGALAV
ncbi:WecB/TagA/CpsF family glycosyltransferase [Mycobacterium sp. 1245805.9]|uniref:WecB/TagA/CpsF family glycosyltransferase n=1 Tax=Mycobacterium sp. 1245805.9 TaxID=1856862 RepID=UPI0009ED0D90|nr:WecB/TagA/CpsF family glycosyltransferase [Mycobacterium sp. 1245805.9]